MPALTNTISIPDGNPNEILTGTDLSIKLIVLGNNPNLAEIANTLAQDAPTFPRFVIWYKTPVLADLQIHFPELNTLENLKGFSASTKNRIAYKIEETTSIDFLSISQAF